METNPSEAPARPGLSNRALLLWTAAALSGCLALACVLLFLFLGLPWLMERLQIGFETGMPPQHGLEVVLQAETGGGEQPSKEAMQRAVQVLNRRAESLKLTEYAFTASGPGEITARLPVEAADSSLLMSFLEVGQVEFVDVGSQPVEEDSTIATDLDPDAPLPVYHTIFTGEQVNHATVTKDPIGNYVVSVELTAEGRHIFARHTRENVGKYLAVTLDKRVLTVPSIQSEISAGSAVIEGGFSYEEANRLAVLLRSKALPFKMKVVRQEAY